jgi:hypothetical protein
LKIQVDFFAVVRVGVVNVSFFLLVCIIEIVIGQKSGNAIIVKEGYPHNSAGIVLYKSKYGEGNPCNPVLIPGDYFR